MCVVLSIHRDGYGIYRRVLYNTLWKSRSDSAVYSDGNNQGYIEVIQV